MTSNAEIQKAKAIEVLDPIQWCELCAKRVETVTPFLRVTPRPHRTVHVLMACPKCIQLLKQSELTLDSEWAGVVCQEVVTSRRPTLPPEVGTKRGQAQELARERKRKAQEKEYMVTLTPTEVAYLRALGFELLSD